MDNRTIQNFIDEVVTSYDLSDYSAMYSLVERCIDRVDEEDVLNGNIEDLAYSSVDDELIYYDDQWELMRAWNENPREANLDEAWCDLNTMVIEVLDKMREELISEKRDELNSLLANIRNSIINLHNQVMQIQDDLDSIKYDDCVDLVDEEEVDDLDNQLQEIESFLSEYDVLNNCEVETTSDEDLELEDIDDLEDL